MLTVMELVCPESALSAPVLGPIRLMSGLNHQMSWGLWFPSSPGNAAIKMHVSFESPGSLAIANVLRCGYCQELARSQSMYSIPKSVQQIKVRKCRYWFNLKSGTGVSPGDHAPDARATFKLTSTEMSRP